MFPPTSTHWQKVTLELQQARYFWSENGLTIRQVQDALTKQWSTLFHCLKNSQRYGISLHEKWQHDEPELPNLIDMTIVGNNISVVFQKPQARSWNPFARTAAAGWQPILPL
ncbi:MAG: hypothetical protein K5Q00_06620 [Gammaproteobacteria bacterium]|nr:hypothetical protein [Gammaproteobacteria bacterium]